CQDKSLNGLQTLANNVLSGLHEWCSFNKMAVNAGKTHLMLFTLANIPSADNPLIMYNGTPLKYVSTTKILGVYFDQKLNFNEHIAYLKKTLAWKISILHRTRHHLPAAIKLRLYYAHIQSHLYYCNLVWGTASRTHLHELF